MSLNPKKTLFGLQEGKLLGHIISEEGIKIDPTRIDGILQISHPRSLKELQSFIGKINFLRRFIPNLAELLKNITNMLKKDVSVKWNLLAKQSFKLVKQALTQTPTLISLDFTKDFYIFSFASEHTIAAVLLQKNDLGQEKPIYFFSRALRDAPLTYNIKEKQALALVKALKDFRVYILHSHIISFVPHAVVKDILSQDPDGKRGKWIATILEYDLEIRPTKLVKGQGLAKLMAESNFQALYMNMVDVLEEIEESDAPFIEETFLNSPWYADIIYVLLYLNAPPSWSKTKARFFKKKALSFASWMGYYIGKMLLEFFLNFYLKMMQEKSCMSCMRRMWRTPLLEGHSNQNS